MIVIFVILTLILLIFIGFIFLKTNNNNEEKLMTKCENNSDCPSRENCQVNPEMNNEKQCFKDNTMFCGVTNDKLVKCDLNSVNFCENTCLNNPPFSCIEVTQEKPFNWNDGKTEHVPNSATGFGWCLPNIETTSTFCNKYTSEYILSENEDGKYEWSCLCKYPQLFTHFSGSASNCDKVVTCSGRDAINFMVPLKKPCQENSDCDKDGVCLRQFQTSVFDNTNTLPEVHPTGDKVCHVPWENVKNKIDPFTGRCLCNNDSFDTNSYRTGGGSDIQYGCKESAITCPLSTENCNSTGNQYEENGIQKCCICGTDQIRCPDDINIEVGNNLDTAKFCETYPLCMPDPCNTNPADSPSSGRYDSIQKTCICNEGYGFRSNNNLVGGECVDLCVLNSPCSGRGKCVVINKVAQCYDCVAPFLNDGDEDCLCQTQDGHGGVLGSRCDNSPDFCASGLTCTADPSSEDYDSYCIGTPIKSSPYPIDSAGNYVSGACIRKKKDNEICLKDTDCKSGKCGTANEDGNSVCVSKSS